MKPAEGGAGGEEVVLVLACRVWRVERRRLRRQLGHTQPGRSRGGMLSRTVLVIGLLGRVYSLRISEVFHPRRRKQLRR